MFYGDLCFECVLNRQTIDLSAADIYTAKILNCSLGDQCGAITHMLKDGRFQKMRFRFRDKSTVFGADSLFTFQTPCIPCLAGILPAAEYAPSNVVFSKREGCKIIMHFEKFCFTCEKKNGGVFLYAGDEDTAKSLGCTNGTLCGNITYISSSNGVQQMRFVFSEQSITYESTCLFTYQTSCLPWLMSILHPGKTML